MIYTRLFFDELVMSLIYFMFYNTNVSTVDKKVMQQQLSI